MMFAPSREGLSEVHAARCRRLPDILKRHSFASEAFRSNACILATTKIAMGYRGYGLAISELISEGNVGLMQALKRFEPEKGFRLTTYAMWWIRASIQE